MSENNNNDEVSAGAVNEEVPTLTPAQQLQQKIKNAQEKQTKLKKQMNVDVQNIKTGIKSSEYYVADVNLDGILDKTVACANSVLKGKPNVSCLFVSARDDSTKEEDSLVQVCVVAHVPESKLGTVVASSQQKHFTAEDFMKSAIAGISNCNTKVEKAGSFVTATVLNTEGKYSLVIKEQIRAQAFAFFKLQKVLEEEEEEEFIGFDDI